MVALLAATRDGVVRVDRGAPDSWVVASTLPGADVRSLCASGADVYAGTAGDGVYRSADGGRSWSVAGLRDEFVTALAVGDGVVYAGTREPRVHASTDGGETWSPLARFPWQRSWWWIQPAERPFRPSFVSALAVSEGVLVAGIEACGVLRSTDGGTTWSGHRRHALRDCHELAAEGASVYEAASGGLALSRDRGDRWIRLREGLDRRYGWAVAVAGDTAYLVVASYRSAHAGRPRARIFRSVAAGPWEACGDELPRLAKLACVARGEVVAALGDGSLLRSTDSGDTWTRLPVALGMPSRALAYVV